MDKMIKSDNSLCGSVKQKKESCTEAHRETTEVHREKNQITIKIHKKMQNKSVLIGVFLIYGMLAFGQRDVMKRVYEYDAAGNRVMRSVFVLKSPSQKSMDNADEEAKEEYSFVDNLEDIKIRVFPNPTTSTVSINIENVEVLHNGVIQIYNVTGTQLRTQTISALNTSIDLSSYPAGIYLVNITINGKETKWKIVKE